MSYTSPLLEVKVCWPVAVHPAAVVVAEAEMEAAVGSVPPGDDGMGPGELTMGAIELPGVPIGIELAMGATVALEITLVVGVAPGLL